VDALTSLETDYPTETAAIEAARAHVTTARSACAALNSFGTTAEIKATSNAAVTDLNLQVKAANAARNGVKADKKKVD